MMYVCMYLCVRECTSVTLFHTDANRVGFDLGALFRYVMFLRYLCNCFTAGVTDRLTEQLQQRAQGSAVQCIKA